MSKIKLFEAHSVIDNFGHREVAILWIKSHPQRSDYKSLIVDYDNLTKDGRDLARLRLGELFTVTECEQLQEYIRDNHNADVDFHEVDLPIEAKNDFGIFIMSISDLIKSPFPIYLWKDENYDLDFLVHGMLMMDD